jgi:hypothetical protein
LEGQFSKCVSIRAKSDVQGGSAYLVISGREKQVQDPEKITMGKDRGDYIDWNMFGV